MRALARLLPDIEVVQDCPFQCAPAEPKWMHDGCAARHAAGERLPAVFYVCGHSGRGRNGNKTAYQSHGIWFARHGYLCLVLDTLQLGEIPAVHAQFPSADAIADIQAAFDQAKADLGRMIPIGFTKFQPPPGFSLKLFEQARFQPAIRPLKEDVVGNIGGVLWVLFGGIGIVLLIACANVAQLLLARGAGRGRERGALAAAQFVDWPVEDDQRQDVGLFERRHAGQRQLRRLHGASWDRAVQWRLTARRTRWCKDCCNIPPTSRTSRHRAGT